MPRDGDRIVSTERIHQYSNGQRDTASYSYGVTSVNNPLYGNTYWQRLVSLTTFSNEGLDGLCPYVLKNISTINGTDIQFETQTSGGRLTSLTENGQFNSGAMKIFSVSNYEFEYR